MFGPVGVKAAKIGILEVRCNESKCQRRQILKSSSAEEKAKSNRGGLTAGSMKPSRPALPGPASHTCHSSNNNNDKREAHKRWMCSECTTRLDSDDPLDLRSVRVRLAMLRSIRVRCCPQ